MRRRFVNKAERTFWQVEIEIDDQAVVVKFGDEGTPGTEQRVPDTYEAAGLPAVMFVDQLIGALPAGYEEVIPDDLLALVERAQDVKLTGRLRAFYENHEYKQHQGKYCKGLDCKVDFIADVVQLPFTHEFYDRKAKQNIQLIAISSKLVGKEYKSPDEQQWIGVDPAQGDGPVYALFTSNAYEHAYDTLDAFLADLA
jgi:hypothetical protein